LITAQIHAARGVLAMFVRGKGGRARRVEYPAVAEALLNTPGRVNGRDYWCVAMRQPDVRAWTDLANRVLGKPQDAVDITSADGSLTIIHRADDLDDFPPGNHGGDAGGARARHPARGHRQPVAGQSLLALCARRMAAAGERSVRFCRYAGDAVIHCKSEAQARLVLVYPASVR
jgi:hypothetical protein